MNDMIRELKLKRGADVDLNLESAIAEAVAAERLEEYNRGLKDVYRAEYKDLPDAWLKSELDELNLADQQATNRRNAVGRILDERRQQRVRDGLKSMAGLLFAGLLLASGCCAPPACSSVAYAPARSNGAGDRCKLNAFIDADGTRQLYRTCPGQIWTEQMPKP